MGIKDKKKLNVVKMKYKIEENTKNIRIFGKKFVNNNKKICMIILNNKIFEIEEFLIIIDSYLKEIQIKLLIISNIIYMESMFENCSSLIFLSNSISYLNTNKVKKISNLFYRCNSKDRSL